jgi:molybdopterin converting factor small subunit
MAASTPPAPTIELLLFATLRRFLPADASAYPITAGDTVGEVMARIGIPRPEAKLIFVDGRHASLEHPLHGGERIGIFPPVGGG